MSGIVTGGWHFVWAAYIVSAMVIGAWAVRTFAALRDAPGSREHSEP